ncbi:hypothetical protein SPRG_15468 [Saprolegnia parasitica CBS 223.65]|uniref:Uncharacterized protein n=1 Tax=Saprolegnia parasitica (strain CBS 223.65) TaxID=695850 RepID=A0A067BME5_SAPPC|nr:hypothetical protein SPRG_15468 [Saprolegnia parasitica CBS 223.65]KDO19378.1 hypothetical protein SPRG_15468 [Saprolegnia parasitica CBS 223.65]|eukprot:XP_012209923.1 hypothetical protein SPRG_15468 [Saprolegnia parasitica CBS 223.65]
MTTSPASMVAAMTATARQAMHTLGLDTEDMSTPASTVGALDAAVRNAMKACGLYERTRSASKRPYLADMAPPLSLTGCIVAATLAAGTVAIGYHLTDDAEKAKVDVSPKTVGFWASRAASIVAVKRLLELSALKCLGPRITDKLTKDIGESALRKAASLAHPGAPAVRILYTAAAGVVLTHVAVFSVDLVIGLVQYYARGNTMAPLPMMLRGLKEMMNATYNAMLSAYLGTILLSPGLGTDAMILMWRQRDPTTAFLYLL